MQQLGREKAFPGAFFKPYQKIRECSFLKAVFVSMRWCSSRKHPKSVKRFHRFINNQQRLDNELVRLIKRWGLERQMDEEFINKHQNLEIHRYVGPLVQKVYFNIYPNY